LFTSGGLGLGLKNLVLFTSLNVRQTLTPFDSTDDDDDDDNN